MGVSFHGDRESTAFTNLIIKKSSSRHQNPTLSFYYSAACRVCQSFFIIKLWNQEYTLKFPPNFLGNIEKPEKIWYNKI